MLQCDCTAAATDFLCELKDAQKVLKDAIDTIEISNAAKDVFCRVSYKQISFYRSTYQVCVPKLFSYKQLVMIELLSLLGTCQ